MTMKLARARISATPRRDLRSGSSPWRARARASVPTRALRKVTRCDVVVVGAGISGALIADALIDAGLEVRMVDRRGVARGSTPASTALLLYELDTPLRVLKRRLGWPAARQAWMRSRLAQLALGERIRELGIHCGLAERDALYLSGTSLNATALHEEHELRRDAGFSGLWLTRGQVERRFGITRRSAILSHGDMQANPLALTLELIRSGVQRGLQLHAPCDIAGVQSSAREVRLLTTTGQELRCAHAVFATGYEPLKCLGKLPGRIVSTWAIATVPQPRTPWPERCLIWEASDPYLYLRTDDRNRILCGGEDESFMDEERRTALMPAKVRTLQRKLAALLPGVRTRAQHSWSGCFGDSPTGLPVIAPVPGLERCLVAMGYGGNGITFSMLAAQMIRAHVLGRPDADAALFGFRSG